MKGDVLALAGVPPEDLHIVLLDAAGLVLDAVVGVGDGLAEKTLAIYSNPRNHKREIPG